MKRQGFTLIEILVSVTILMLFTGLSMLTINSFNDRQKAQGIRGQIKSMLELTKNYASTMQYPSAATEKPILYELFFDGNVAKIKAKFSGSDSNFLNSDYDFGLDVGLIGNTSPTCFEPFDATYCDCVACAGVGDTKTISINGHYNLTINTDGKIEEVDIP